ncbi:hypothetical protein OOK31_34085 [Streptomyces sp. NBC_00249]|uniref:hypothetical protein n=1 Tax=Streptomyces sp. NBC_00249 TaxID=2975690 RepID=UPI0022563CCB|nr:hypothetical protein [Streptomyces sp. NBC_00249]MCX5198858.1 hypothetical protein [Streptomyces sp. NBC_00249]
MHHHGYAWVGEKKTFDNEALRRPPHADPPPPALPGDAASQRLVERYREVVAEFTATDLPPIQTAHWLMKPRGVVKGTWEEPKGAGEWLGLQLAEAAPRFASQADREATRLALLVEAAVERLTWGGDVSWGHYLNGTLFRSVAVVTCSPNRSRPELSCPHR